MAKDLKLVAKLDNQVSAQVDKIVSDINKIAKAAQKADDDHARSVQEFVKEENRRSQEAAKISAQMNRDLEKSKREQARINEQASRNSLQVTRNQAEAAQRIERQAQIAIASLTENRFDRRIAVEKMKHSQTIQVLKGNHAAIEAEVMRHNAVLSRISMDKAAFPNTPFQKMLNNFDKLNTKLYAAGPAIGAVSGKLGSAGVSAGGFGTALSLLSAGPLGLAIGGVAALGFAVDALIKKQDQAANKMMNMGQTMRDPKQLEQLIKYAEVLEKTRHSRGNPEGKSEARKGFESMSGVDYYAEGNRNTLDVLRGQQAALPAFLAGQEKKNELQMDLQRQLNEAIAANEQNEFVKRRAAEKSRNEESLAKLREKHLSEATEEKLHLQMLANIQKDEETKRAEEQKAKNIKAAEEKLKAQEQIVSDLEEVDRLIADIDHEEFLRVQNNEKLKREEAKKTAQMKATLAASSVSQGIQALSILAGKNKALFALTKMAAIAEIGVATARNIVTQPGPLGALTPYWLALGASQAAVVGAQAIKGYRSGGYTGSGYADEPAGIVHGGEYVLNRADVARMGGVAGVEGAKNGGSGMTHRGDVNISITLPAGATREQAAQAGAVAADAYRARLKEFKTLERDSAYYGVTA